MLTSYSLCLFFPPFFTFKFAHFDHYLEELQNIGQNVIAAGTDSATSVADLRLRPK